MRTLVLALSSVVLLFTSSAQAPLDSQPELKRIAGDILVNGHAYDTLSQLTEQFGPRLSGSDNYKRAADWALAQFRSYGVDDVRLEYWTLAHGWKRGTATAEILSPAVNGEQPHSVHIVAAGWSSSTAHSGAEGDVYMLDNITPDFLKSRASDLKGKIVLVEGVKPTHNSELDTLDREQLSARLAPYGVLALLEPAHAPNDVIGTGDPAWHADILPTPTANLGYEDTQALLRALKRGTVRIRVDIQNTISGAVQVPNIVAEVRGASKPEEWVLLGAHFDSWDLATGAQDNGAGTAQVMEAARALAELAKSGKGPARTIRFALFAGEEEGLLGSFAYAEQHKTELAKCAAMLNTDNGAGLPQGWNAEGRKDVADALRPISERLLRGLNGSGIENKTDFDTDHGPFLVQGVPVLNMWVDMSKYGEVHHLVGDTIEKVNRHNLEDGAALLAVTAYTLSNADKPLGPQLTHAQVEQLLKPEDLGEYLKQSGLWF